MSCQLLHRSEKQTTHCLPKSPTPAGNWPQTFDCLSKAPTQRLHPLATATCFPKAPTPVGVFRRALKKAHSAQKLPRSCNLFTSSKWLLAIDLRFDAHAGASMQVIARFTGSITWWAPQVRPTSSHLHPPATTVDGSSLMLSNCFAPSAGTCLLISLRRVKKKFCWVLRRCSSPPRSVPARLRPCMGPAPGELVVSPGIELPNQHAAALLQNQKLPNAILVGHMYPWLLFGSRWHVCRMR